MSRMKSLFDGYLTGDPNRRRRTVDRMREVILLQLLAPSRFVMAYLMAIRVKNTGTMQKLPSQDPETKSPGLVAEKIKATKADDLLTRY